MFDTWRFHAFFTTTDHDVADTVSADKTHRGHAIIEQVHADLKHAALAHLPSGKFTANAAWLVLAVMAFNLTRAAATLTGPGLAKATTATIRRKLIAVPARVASSARRVTLHLPAALALGDRLERPVQPGLRTTTGTDDLTAPPTPARRPTWNDLAARPDQQPRPHTRGPRRQRPRPLSPSSLRSRAVVLDDAPGSRGGLPGASQPLGVPALIWGR